MHLVAVSLSTLLCGALLTILVRTIAQRYGFVAAPRPDRWHQKPTALFGGIAIYLAFMAGYGLYARSLASASPLLVAGSLLFVAGLIDDLASLKPYTKLVIQLVAAVIVVQYGLHLPWTNSRAVNDLLTLFWLLGITNAINLLDNMDGLAGGVSVIACVFLGITFLLNGQTDAARLPAILGGALLGFLVFNLPPASIFMGDCGSMFLGLVLSATALLSDYGRTRHLVSVLSTPVFIMLIPIFDTCLVTVTRKLSGRPVSQGGRDHTSHRLVALGVPERRAVLHLYWFAAVSGGLALLVRWLNTEITLLLVPSFVLIVLFFGFYLGRVRIYTSEQPPQDSTIINALVGFFYKRRSFEVLLDMVLGALAYYCAYLIRFDGNPPAQHLGIFVETLPLVIAIQMLSLLVVGVYRGLWHYVSVSDFVVILKGVFIGAIASSLAILMMYGLHGPSRGVLVLNALLLLTAVSASRLSFRLFQALIVGRDTALPDAIPVVIYGAGNSGDLLLRELRNNPEHHYAPVGFIDDDTLKIGKHLHGFRIFESSQLSELRHRYGVNEVLVSSSKVPESRLEALRDLGVGLKRLSIRIE